MHCKNTQNNCKTCIRVTRFRELNRTNDGNPIPGGPEDAHNKWLQGQWIYHDTQIYKEIVSRSSED